MHKIEKIVNDQEHMPGEFPPERWLQESLSVIEPPALMSKNLMDAIRSPDRCLANWLSPIEPKEISPGRRLKFEMRNRA
jgi:hypothetical protein